MRHRGGRLVVGLLAALLLAGCAHIGEDAAHREWRVADDKNASPDEIIEAGGPVDVARSGGQTVVAWQVQPEDDEGPYQGAWRLYGKDGDPIADGRFKQVFEANAQIEVDPRKGGFVLTSYVNQQPYLLNREGDLRRPPKGANLATVLGTHRVTEMYSDLTEWRMQVPGQKRLVRWDDLPTEEPQEMLFAGGELWVLLPRKQDYETGRIAHSNTGRAPWTIETIPNPPGTAIDSQSLSVSGGSLFTAAVKFGTGSNGDREDVASILRRPLTAKGQWENIDPTGIDDGILTVAPRIFQLAHGRLLATGEGAWLRSPGGDWEKVPQPESERRYPPAIGSDGTGRLWSFGPHNLHYSDDLGTTWIEFER